MKEILEYDVPKKHKEIIKKRLNKKNILDYFIFATKTTKEAFTYVCRDIESNIIFIKIKNN